MQAPWDLPKGLLLSRRARGLTYSLIAVSSGIWVAIKGSREKCKEQMKQAVIRKLRQICTRASNLSAFRNSAEEMYKVRSSDAFI